MTTKALLVATGPVTESTIRLLSDVAQIVIAPDNTEQTLLEFAPQAEGFIVRGDSRLTDAVIEAAPRLKLIARSGVGVDGVDVDTATHHQIPVIIVPEAGVDAVAEGTFAMLLSLVKSLPQLDAAMRSGNWDAREQIPRGDMMGATIGLVGLGRIGHRVAELGLAFGMDIVATDPAVDGVAMSAVGVDKVRLDELFARSQYISLHAPLQPETRGMITSDLLQTAGPGAFLVNLSRGGLLESLDALKAALDTGTLAGAALDVFDPEPPDLGHPIFSHPRVLVAPHALGLTTLSSQRIFEDMSQSILAVLRGERPEVVANPEVYQ